MIQYAITYQDHFQKRRLLPQSLTLAMTGTVIKQSDRDGKAWHEYIEHVLKNREDGEAWYKACKEQIIPSAL